jgi:hypothetical protein
MEELQVRCACHSRDHTAYFDYFEEDGELYLTIHLSESRGFWKRLWYGLKYAFGYQSRFGAWDEIVIRWEDTPKIRALMEKRENHPSKFVQEALDKDQRPTKPMKPTRFEAE